MHVIKTKKGPSATTTTGKAFTTGSGLTAMAAAKPAPSSIQNAGGNSSVPPSTR